jgi:enoyl-CoA hydratase/carnithine racemase
MSYTTILVDKKVEEKLGIITLNRPEVRNAINQALRTELFQAFADMEADGNVRAIIVTGGAKVFAAGADIAAMVQSTSQEMFDNSELWDFTLKWKHRANPL